MVAVLWIFCGLVAWSIAGRRGHNGCLWSILGFLFGPLGLIAAFALNNKTAESKQDELLEETRKQNNWMRRKTREAIEDQRYYEEIRYKQQMHELSTEEECEEDNRGNYENQTSKDAYEGTHIDGTDKELSLELEIDYVDREGSKTTREIMLKRFRLSPDKTEGVLSAYCYLREGHRDFYISRIKRLTDLDTGEVIDNICSFLEDEYEISTGGQIEQIWTNYADEMNILVYVGKLDGMLRKKEKELIATWASSRYDVLPEERHAEEVPGERLMDAIIEDLKTITSISKTQFARALGRISKQSWENKNELLCYVKEIFGFPTRDETKEELKIISYIEKRLFTKEEQGI